MLTKLLDTIVKLDMPCEFHVTKKLITSINTDNYMSTQTTYTLVIMDMPSRI